jgi:pyruvate formate-lyase activating enzyme-like uncharacterized protein
MTIERTQYHSWRAGELAKGCRLCAKGEKLVLFITGICSQKCYFCPLSAQKKGKDIIYANEWPITELSQILEEAKLTDAKGAGITGGDPLLKLDRTVSLIQLLKRRFGSNFHIHLYTPLANVNFEMLRRLKVAELDEIRFHPQLDDETKWDRIKAAGQFDWDVGVEIPVVPKMEKETIKLINFIKDKVDFLNLNELELSSTNSEQLAKLGYTAKDKTSYGVAGSEELAMRLLVHCDKIGLRAHYCTTTLKDKEQLAKRILRRAKHVSKKYDRVTEEGMLVRGAIYPKGLEPGFNYREEIAKADNEKTIKELEALRNNLLKRFSLGAEMMAIDDRKLRILTSETIARRVFKNIQNKCAIVEEYPTYDQFEVEVEIL